MFLYFLKYLPLITSLEFLSKFSRFNHISEFSINFFNLPLKFSHILLFSRTQLPFNISLLSPKLLTNSFFSYIQIFLTLVPYLDEDCVGLQVHKKAAEKLLELCRLNKGVYIKVGQHIGALEYVLSVKYVDTMKVLYSQAPASTIEEIYQVFQEDLKKNVTWAWNFFLAYFQKWP